MNGESAVRMQNETGTDHEVKVRFQNVSKHYGDVEVVHDVSFDIREGDFVSLVGPSGCGKTTMMNMLAGFVKPNSGEVLLEGKPVEGPGPDRGVMFQEYGVFPWLTVEKNIRFGLDLAIKRHIPKDERRQITEKYMNLMRLSDFRNAWPKNLSGGMRQRLALARAYAANPHFLLMDEPFGALDAQTRSDMHELLHQILQAERKTALLITHSVDEAIYLSSRVIVISARPSRIVESIDIPFGFPRDKSLLDSREFIDLRIHLREQVMKQYAEQQALR
ncbi:ABC transporter [Nitratireductor indicus C115]|uniref:ABC transporter n=1 Tax=Nitratireductor indicus C115 TaxID=1231190 RepID=K2NUY1_9HYPH|nr:ABC transporter ATP-binding protein [Nitratireductor indicus]EKF41639.1 ABC transporter [Nitratireductor indicus C115]SFQ70723.1 NitT/TauT family transport system ATP-binding protein [Nitratireductor indicus]